MITLLNGEQFEEKELLEKMQDDIFYYGHLGKNALSKSAFSDLLKSPRTYRNKIFKETKPSTDLEIGKLLHWAILEPDKFQAIHVVDATTKNTNKYKEAIQKHSEVYLKQQVKQVERLADALLSNENIIKEINKSEFEIPACAIIEGLPFRAKADIVKKDKSLILDLKTTKTDLEHFHFDAHKYKYHLQAYLYKRMFKKDDFKFIVINKVSTDTAIFETSKEFIEKGEKEFYKAVKTFKYWQKRDWELDSYIFRGTL